MLIDLKVWVNTLVPYIGFILIYFSKIVKQENLAYVNHARIRSWNQPVLSNESSFLLKEQREPLMGLELTDIHRLRDALSTGVHHLYTCLS